MVKGKHIPCTYEDCKEVFPSRRALNAHEVEIHCPYNIYECEVCHKSLASKQSMKEHMNKHTGNKPHSCSVCHERFRRAGQLSIHKRKHRSAETNRELAELNKKKRKPKDGIILPYTTLPPIDFEGTKSNNQDTDD